ncbi:hypothetical protein [Ligilactobacillus sp.]|uniref:hypothetical protein n=1 Tax=Ligilactobacillus sp. TaxID=2767921 RepID=UPI002FE3FCD2
MMIAIIGLCLLIFAIVFVVLRIRRNKALAIMQNASLEITSQAFKETIAMICVPGFDGENAEEAHKAEMISDVWGKGVMAFEYSLDAPDIKTNELESIKDKLVEALNEYAKRKELKGLNGRPCFVVSDIWIFAGVLHIDISHVVNQATVDYLHDVTKGAEK